MEYKLTTIQDHRLKAIVWLLFVFFLVSSCNSQSFTGSATTKPKKQGNTETEQVTVTSESTTPAPLEFDACLDPAKLSQYEQDISFPATPNCDWGAPENVPCGPSASGQCAQRTQNVPFNLEQGKRICSLKITSVEQAFYYDDDIYFTFGKIILVSSLDYSKSEVFQKVKSDMMVFEWEKIRKPEGYDSKMIVQLYCLGKETGKTVCQFPKSETTGSISFELDPKIALDLGEWVLDQPKYEFGFLTTGSGNAATDCTHSDLKFHVAVTYVVK